MSTLIDEFI